MHLSGRTLVLVTCTLKGLPKMPHYHRIAAVAHGCCSSFRDWAAEETNHPREVIEAALGGVLLHRVSSRAVDRDHWLATSTVAVTCCTCEVEAAVRERPGGSYWGAFSISARLVRNGNARSSGEVEDDERTSPVERLDEALQHRGSQDRPDSCRRDPGRQRPARTSARVPAPAVRNRPATSRSTRPSVVSGGSFRRTASS